MVPYQQGGGNAAERTQVMTNPRGDTMHLTAGMRVRDGELWAEECLRSLSSFVDDIVILDDGSTDRTVEICRSFDKVRHLPRWPRSFCHEAIARNVVLAMAGRRGNARARVEYYDGRRRPGARRTGRGRK